MLKVLTVTAQGQVTIPAEFRRKLNLNKNPKASVRLEEEKIIIEPLPDFLQLGGILHKRAKKNISVAELMRQEQEAIDSSRISK